MCELVEGVGFDVTALEILGDFLGSSANLHEGNYSWILADSKSYKFRCKFVGKMRSSLGFGRPFEDSNT